MTLKGFFKPAKSQMKDGNYYFSFQFPFSDIGGMCGYPGVFLDIPFFVQTCQNKILSLVYGPTGVWNPPATLKGFFKLSHHRCETGILLFLLVSRQLLTWQKTQPTTAEKRRKLKRRKKKEEEEHNQVQLNGKERLHQVQAQHGEEALPK